MELAYPVLSGAVAQQAKMELITNNLANVGTTGFKKDIAVFMGTTAPQIGETDSITDPATFGSLSHTVTDFSSGAIKVTGDPLDVAIEGDGFFAISTPQGTRYTRNGNFTLNADGLLSLGEFPVEGGGGPITLPAGQVLIDPEGKISVKGVEAGAEPIEIDRIPVYTFAKPGDLKKVGGSLFEVVGGGATPSIEAHVRQGALEASNVNPVEEMVAMIEVMRLYESSQKAIQTADEIAAKTANELGTLA